MLNHYLNNPDTPYHVRGLVREMKEEINAVRRELQNLESIGILTSEKRSNKLLYTLNKESIFLKELKNLLRKDSKEIRLIARGLKELNPSLAILTDNFFTGKHQDKFDVDLLIVTEANAHQVNEALKPLEEKLEKELRVAAVSPNDLTFQIKKRDPFLLNLMAKDKITLIGSDQILYQI